MIQNNAPDYSNLLDHDTLRETNDPYYNPPDQQVQPSADQQNQSQQSMPAPQNVPSDPNMINTMFGPMSKSMPMMQTGTPENKQMLTGMINSFAGGGPSAGEISSGLKYINPTKDIESLFDEIGSGAKTADENLRGLADSIKSTFEKNKSDALDIKQGVLDTAGKAPMDTTVGSYLTNSKKAQSLYDDDLDSLHDTFVKNPTFENADKLQSQLGNEIGYYQRASDKGNLDPADLPKLKALKSAKDAINQDQDTLLGNLSPELKQQYQDFKTAWKTNVVPYRSSPFLKSVTNKGAEAGITPTNVSTEFSFPDANATKIANDIGQQGKNRILFNEVGKTGSANDLVDAISKAYKEKGMQNYVPEGLIERTQGLAKRENYGNIAKEAGYAGGGGLIGLAAGHPILGAMAGTAIKHKGDIGELVKLLGKKMF